MNAASVQGAQVGMALFDMWQAAVDKAHGKQKAKGSPLVAAAAAAFEQYVQGAEAGMQAQIAGVAGYAMNPQGNGVITVQQMAPLLALNVMG